MNLVYYSISGNSDYVKLIEMSINSLLKNYKNDILIICDEDIKNILMSKYNSLLFMIIDKVDSNLSSGNKLRIYEYDNIHSYENILYLDCDILITKNIDDLFFECNDKFVVSSESENNDKIIDEYWAGNLLTTEEKEKYKNIPSINAGCFLFKNIENNIDLLRKTYEMYKNGIEYLCYEQPYFNYNLLKNNKFINTLQKHITHQSYNNFDINKSINHYCGGPGNFIFKYDMMLRDYKKNLINYDTNRE